jgi:hypothetical protein
MGPLCQAPTRSLRPTGACRVDAQARSTDQYQGSTSASRSHRVRPDLSIHSTTLTCQRLTYSGPGSIIPAGSSAAESDSGRPVSLRAAKMARAPRGPVERDRHFRSAPFGYTSRSGLAIIGRDGLIYRYQASCSVVARRTPCLLHRRACSPEVDSVPRVPIASLST